MGKESSSPSKNELKRRRHCVNLVLCVVNSTETEAATHSFCDRGHHTSKGDVSDTFNVKS